MIKKRIGLQFKHYSFTPHLVPSLITLFLLVLLIWLGFWQLNRAQQKRNLIISYQALKTSKPIKLSSMTGAAINYRYTPVNISGKFDNQHTILLDNRTYQGRAGYQVLSPFIPTGATTAVLINRGWVPMGKTRNELPGINAIKGTVSINGIIDVPINNLTLSTKKELNEQWPIRIQTINNKFLAKVLGYPVHQYIVLLSPKSPYGFVRNWSPKQLNPQKNIAYAIQWFALALVLIIIFVVVNTHRITPKPQSKANKSKGEKYGRKHPH